MKGKCRNCERVLTIVSDKCCYVCYHAGKGLEGEEKDTALAAAKKKIQSGGLQKVGLRRKRPAETLPDMNEKHFEEVWKRGDRRLGFAADKIKEDAPEPCTSLSPSGIPAHIPLTISLTIEVAVRFTGIA